MNDVTVCFFLNIAESKDFVWNQNPISLRQLQCTHYQMDHHPRKYAQWPGANSIKFHDGFMNILFLIPITVGHLKTHQTHDCYDHVVRNSKMFLLSLSSLHKFFSLIFSDLWYDAMFTTQIVRNRFYIMTGQIPCAIHNM